MQRQLTISKDCGMVHDQLNSLLKPMELRSRFVEANVTICFAIVLSICCVVVTRCPCTSPAAIELMAYLVHHFKAHRVQLIQNCKLVFRRVGKETVNHPLVDSLWSLAVHDIL